MDYFDLKYTQAYAELNIIGTNMDMEKISDMLGMRINYIRKQGDYRFQDGDTVSISPSVTMDKEAIWTYKTKNSIS